MFDGLIDKQYERKVREVCSVERDEQVIEQLLDELDQSGNPLVSQIDDWFRGSERHWAEVMSRLELLKLLGEKPKMMTAGSGSRQCDRVRRRLVRSLAKEHPELSCNERWAKADELTDEQIIESIQKVHHQVKGVALAGPVGDIGQWLSTIWQFIKDHWMQILGVLLSLLVFI